MTGFGNYWPNGGAMGKRDAIQSAESRAISTGGARLGINRGMHVREQEGHEDATPTRQRPQRATSKPTRTSTPAPNGGDDRSKEGREAAQRSQQQTQSPKQREANRILQHGLTLGMKKSRDVYAALGFGDSAEKFPLDAEWFVPAMKPDPKRDGLEGLSATETGSLAIEVITSIAVEMKGGASIAQALETVAPRGQMERRQRDKKEISGEAKPEPKEGSDPGSAPDQAKEQPTLAEEGKGESEEGA